MYSSGTLEFRLLRIHFFTEHSYNDALTRWKAGRLLDIFGVVSVPYMEQHAREAYLRESFDQASKIIDSVSLFALEQQHVTKPKATDEDRENYIKLLGSKSYSTMEEVKQAMEALNQAIQEAGKNADSI